MFPGSNLLEDAFLAIDPLEIQWMRYRDRTLSEAGMWITGYDDPVPVEASVQAVNRSRYLQMGLDFNKNYVMLYLSQDVLDLQRDSAPDRFILPDQRVYQVVSETDWFGEDGSWATGINGWTAVLVVKLSKAEAGVIPNA